MNEQKNKPELWKAFCRRIDKIMVFTAFMEWVEFKTTGSVETGDQHLASDKYFDALAKGLLGKQSQAS